LPIYINLGNIGLFALKASKTLIRWPLLKTFGKLGKININSGKVYPGIPKPLFFIYIKALKNCVFKYN